MKRRFFLLSQHLISMGMLVWLSASCQGRPAGELETLNLGLPALEQNALIYIADQQGFFAENGLHVIIKDYDSGVTAIDGLSKEEVDLAVAAEFPVMKALLQKSPLSIIASSDQFENDYLIGRKDRGIETIPDLKGRRIGVTLGSINEFYLARFLELNGIALDEVTVVDLKPAEFAAAITGGEVDALVAWQPYINQILEKQPDLALWPVQNNQAVNGLLVVRQDWLNLHGKTVQQFLQALLQAERFSLSSPGLAREIVQERLGYDSAYIDTIWPQHHFSLTLDFSLIGAMNDEAHWMIDQDLTDVKEIPDFLESIDSRGLERIKPDAVNIIH